jgi:hypothetical protein
MKKVSRALKGRTTFRLFSFLVVVLVIAICSYLSFLPVLVVKDTESGRLLWSQPIKNGGSFAIRWIHSIHRTPVVEYYRVQDGRIVLTEMTFKDYGIGMESELAPGEKLIAEHGTFRIVNMNRLFPALHLFIGQVRANHTLLYQGKEFPLGMIGKPGSAVTIQVEQQTIFQLDWRVIDEHTKHESAADGGTNREI